MSAHPRQRNSPCLPIPRPNRKTFSPMRARVSRNPCPHPPPRKTKTPSPFPTNRPSSSLPRRRPSQRHTPTMFQNRSRRPTPLRRPTCRHARWQKLRILFHSAQAAPSPVRIPRFQNGNTAGGLKFGEGGSGNFRQPLRMVHGCSGKKGSPGMAERSKPERHLRQAGLYLFDISRSGSPSNVRIEQSSGIPSLDLSAVRALQRIDTFGPLPQGYNGNYVSVEFWFDYRR